MRFIASIVIGAWVALGGVAAADPGGHDREAKEARRSAEALERDVSSLRREVERQGAGAFLTQSVCRLESASESLIEALRCCDVAAVEHGLREVATWYERTVVAVEHDFRLRDVSRTLRVLERVRTHLVETQHLAECWIHATRGSNGWGASSFGRFEQGDSPWSVGGRQSVVVTPFGRPQQFDHFESSWGGQRSELSHRGFQGGSPPPAWHSERRVAEIPMGPPVPGFMASPHSRSSGNGRVGRAILDVVLSELFR